jgi:hypothetical protein
MTVKRLTAKQQARLDNLLPDGKPKATKVRIYDNGGTENGGTVDRYTVVFAGNYNNIGRRDTERFIGEHPVIGMSGAPFHPQGFCCHESYGYIIDRPKYGHLGKKIKFEDLPEDCQKVIIRDYCDLWNLPHPDYCPHCQHQPGLIWHQARLKLHQKVVD